MLTLWPATTTVGTTGIRTCDPLLKTWGPRYVLVSGCASAVYAASRRAGHLPACALCWIASLLVIAALRSIGVGGCAWNRGVICASVSPPSRSLTDQQTPRNTKFTD